MRKVIAIMLMAVLLMPGNVAAEPGFSAEISPQMELLAGVLTQTTWIEKRGPLGEGNEYYRALKEFFSSYRDHEAIKIAQELTDRGFTYDAPVAFICHLGPLPDLELKYEYSDYLVRRAGGREVLEKFRVALAELAGESNFPDFYNSWRSEFEKWIDDARLDGDLVINWLEDFFGQKAADFHLIFAPAMFPGGGYGASVNGPEGEMVSFQIIRESGNGTSKPEFPGGRDLTLLSLHEWGHSFVNPALEKHGEEVDKLGRFFKPVKKAMAAQAYTSPQVFFNEQVLRAIVAIAAQDIYGESVYKDIISYENSRFFYLTEDIVSILGDYRQNRDIYPAFDDFVPVLLAEIGRLEPMPSGAGLVQFLDGLAIAAIVFAGVVLFLKRKRCQQ